MQLTIDRADRTATVGMEESSAQLMARRALRAQIAKLERELSAVVVEGFPHISTPVRARAGLSGGGARLLDLEGLERMRDELAGQVQTARRATVRRAEHEARARELLKRMKLEPGRYRFVRLPVRELGEYGCGVWEVRPRLGLIGMLAGWWQVKLSSGCPLAKGHAVAWPADHTWGLPSPASASVGSHQS